MIHISGKHDDWCEAIRRDSKGSPDGVIVIVLTGKRKDVSAKLTAEQFRMLPDTLKAVGEDMQKKGKEGGNNHHA